MTQDADKPQRRSIRLRGYDYAQAGAYFVTVVTRERTCSFGEIVDGEMMLNEFGRIVQTVWVELPEHYSSVECDACVIMPNHVHGIIVLADDRGGGVNDVGAGLKPARGVVADLNSVRAGLKPAPTRIALPEIVRAFKTFSARGINELRETPRTMVWQRNYYEHVVRGENELNRIREYIANNPLQWKIDRENPNRTGVKSIGKRESWEV